MFDNKKEPQDIFEGVEPPANLPVAGSSTPAPAAAATSAPRLTPPTAARPAVVAPVAPLNPPPAPHGQIVSDRHLGTGGHLWKTILIVTVAFLAMGLAAFLAFRFMNPADSTGNDDRDGATQGDNDENDDLPDGKGGGDDVEPDPVEEVVMDTDGDGLNNDEEREAGTNVSKTDTDGDLLGDREEVKVYGTDPLRVDTDGDSFSDGAEIGSGYNPNGPGKILETPTN